ncbi:DUF5677 domain-containing protein [Spirosoma linguale]
MSTFIDKELKNRGIILDDKQFKLLQSEIKITEVESVDYIQESICDILQKVGIEYNVARELDDYMDTIDGNVLTSFAEDLFTKAIKISFEKTLEKTLELAVNNLTHKIEPILEIQSKERERFGNGLVLIWGDALKKLDFFITTVTEVCRRYHSEHGDLSQREDGITFNALGRLLARACQISFEILTLLRAGFADGAYARWRTLHEVTAIALFISKHGEETAKRYLHHYVVDSYEAALAHQEYYQRLGYEPIPVDEFKDIKDDYDQTISEYGDSFKGQYGWAANALGLKKPTYKDVETSVKLDHLKPYYKYATSNVHATPTGIYAKLSLPESGFRSGLLTGYSMLGLDIPGRSTAMSLYQIAVAYFTLEADADNIHTCNLVEHFKLEVMKAFAEAADKIQVADSKDGE